jgi:glycosyltransferase involved in cell wall biosynthesis
MGWRRREPVRNHNLYYAPDYTAFNPFQSMLNAALGADVTTVPVPARDLVAGLRAAEPGSVFHLHWTAPILQWSKDREAAERALADFVDALDEFQRGGGHLIWSIHNVLPHDSKFRDLDLDLARLLAERADRVHVLSAETPGLVAGLYTLDPARTVLIDHSSYLGQYRDDISGFVARARLGLGERDKVFLTLGGIRPYKGLDRLLDAFEQIDDPDARLLVAGKPRKGEFADDLRRRCDANPRIVSHFAHVPDDELQVWYRSADVVVLPYLDILNSGGFWLATTFGVPVVAPRAGTLASFEGEPHVRLFDPDDPESLRRMLAEALTDLVGNESARASARAAAEDRSPARMAEEYASMVRELLDS